MRSDIRIVENENVDCYFICLCLYLGCCYVICLFFCNVCCDYGGFCCFVCGVFCVGYCDGCLC